MKRILILVIFLFSIICLYANETGIGKIIEINGEVYLDLLGNNNFQTAKVGDTVYWDSVIRTSENGHVKLSVNKQELLIIQNMEISIKNSFKEIKKKNKESLIIAALFGILNEISNSLFPGKKDEIISEYGTKGNDTGNDEEKDGIIWISNKIRDTKYYENAVSCINTKDFLKAFNYLNKIKNYSEISKYPGEINFFKGICYLFTDNYSKAQTQLLLSYELIKNSVTENKIIHPYYLCLGLTAFLNSDFKLAKDVLNEIIESSDEEPKYKNLANTILSRIN